MNSSPLRSLLLGASALLLAALPTQAQRRSHGTGHVQISSTSRPAFHGHGTTSSSRFRAPRSSYGVQVRPITPAYSRYGGTASHTARTWVAGCYASVPQRIWIPERIEQVWVEPVFGFQTNLFGIRVRVLLTPGSYRDVVHPGYYSTQYQRTWVPGHWVLR